MERDLGLEQILVPVDLGPHSETLFAHALRLSLNTGVPLTAVHVADNPDARFHWPAMAEPRDLLVRWGTLPEGATESDVADLGLHVDHDARVAWSPELGIMDVVIDRLPNIIVVGTGARTGLERLRHGSVAEEIARRSGAVTLVVPDGHPGFVDLRTGRVTLRLVVFPIGGAGSDLQHAAEVLETFLEIAGASAVQVVSVHVGDDPVPSVDFDSAAGHIHTTDHRAGSVVDGITAAMDGLEPDLLVMGTSGHDSIGDMIRGSTTERVLRHATCPVLIVPMG